MVALAVATYEAWDGWYAPSSVSLYSLEHRVAALDERVPVRQVLLRHGARVVGHVADGVLRLMGGLRAAHRCL